MKANATDFAALSACFLLLTLIMAPGPLLVPMHALDYNILVALALASGLLTLAFGGVALGIFCRDEQRRRHEARRSQRMAVRVEAEKAARARLADYQWQRALRSGEVW